MGAWAERILAPSIRALQGWFEATLADALPADEARRLARRVAHVPVKGLRAIARDHGLAAARTFLAETGLARPAAVATAVATTATAAAAATATAAPLVGAPQEVVER
jgi:hypothetical protein